jgi:flavin-dependent dehydrogenase
MPKVVILGGGLAGNILARLLRRELPQVSVTLVEPRTTIERKVGESLVEAASKFLIQRLGLSTLLYQEHLPKNGLRFFFGEGPLEERSEIGPNSLGFHPSFQLDRPRLEASLLAMNAADGVEVLRGWRAVSVQVEPNVVALQGPEGEQRTLKADWVIDATGRRRLLARALGLGTTSGHHIRADWVWLRGVADLDTLGSHAWRARFRHTSRSLATCHFLRKNEWTWLIPGRDGITSLGRVGLQPGPLQEIPELLGNAEVVGKGQVDRIAYGSRQIFGPGWALLGDAAYATDPLYSPGLDYVADQADQIVELIRRDGEEETMQAFEAWQQQRYAMGILLVSGQYPVLGNYDLFRVRQVLDLGSYLNLLSVWSERQHLDLQWLQHFLRFARRGRADMARLGQRFAALAQEQAPRHNQGCWDLALPSNAIQARFGEPRRLTARLRYHQRLVAAVDGVLDDLPGKGPGEGRWIRPFFEGLEP